MALVPYRKQNRGEISRLRSEMDDLFNSFFGGWNLPMAESKVWPSIDISEDDEKVMVSAELPGCKSEDIDINVNGRTLSISGEKKQSQEKKEKGYYYCESSYGSFRRDVNIPSEVDPEKIDATYKDGILEINMPKAEKAKTKKISVKSG